MEIMSETEKKILELLTSFKIMDKKQVFQYLTILDRTEKIINTAITALKCKDFIYEIIDGKYLSLTEKPPKNAIALTEAIWVLMANAEAEEVEDYQYVFENATRTKAPTLIAYQKNQCMYYVMRVQCKADLTNMLMLQERLFACGSKDVMESVKAIVIVTDEVLDYEFPEVSYPYICVRIVRDDENTYVEQVVIS